MSKQSREESIRHFMGQDRGTTITNMILGPDGRPMRHESTFSNLPKDLLNKINECMERMEPFGLDSKDSTVILVPAELSAAWYTRDYKKTLQTVRDRPSFVFMLTGILYTHTDFIGPLTVYKFLTSIKIITDGVQRELSEQLLPDQALPDAGKQTGPLEAGGGGI